MRVPNIETGQVQFNKSLIEPKVLLLLEKLAQNPLLVQKLLLSPQSEIQLQLAQNPLLKEIQLPLSTARQVSELAQQPLEAKLTASPKQLTLELTTPSYAGKPLPTAIKLYFSQAKLTDETTIRLTQQLGKNNLEQSLKKPLSSTQRVKDSTNLAPAASSAKSTDSIQTTDKNIQHKPLQEAISHFLKTRPVDSAPLSRSLNQVFKHLDLLENSINQLPTQKQHTKQGQQHSLPLNKAALTELLEVTAKHIPEMKLARQFNKLFSELGQLKQALEFSQNNKQLKIDQRVQNSGNFLETKLESQSKLIPQTRASGQAQTNIPRQGSQQPGQLQVGKRHQPASPVKQATISSGKTSSASALLPEQAIPDLKLINLAVKQSLTDILKTLNQTKSSPLDSGRLLSALAQNRVFIDMVRSAPSQATSTPANTSSQTPLPTSILFGSATVTDKTIQPESALRSPELKQLLLNPQLLATKTKTMANAMQKNELLLLQKQIIREMLTETSSILTKIETNQLLSLKSEAAQLQQFLVELPIFHDQQVESFELLFETRDQKDSAKASKIWSVTVRFDLEPLGPMFARVSMKNDRISTHFFAKQKDTAELLSSHLDYLKQSLFQSGVEIGQLSGQQGVVPDELLANTEHSVDTHA